MIEPKEHDNFYVITGGPGVGKTTLLQELKSRNYETVPEIARELIKEQKAINGNALPWKDESLYKEIMFDRSIKSYEQLAQNRSDKKPVFFDRGFVDTICYATLISSGIDERMNDYALKWRYNKTVFILPPWQEIYAKDNERKQDWKEAVLTFEKMTETYKTYGYTVVEIPKTPPSERANFILEAI